MPESFEINRIGDMVRIIYKKGDYRGVRWIRKSKGDRCYYRDDNGDASFLRQEDVRTREAMHDLRMDYSQFVQAKETPASVGPLSADFGAE